MFEPDDNTSACIEAHALNESIVLRALEEAGVEYEVSRHEPADTMDEAEAIERLAGAPVVKNLFLTNRRHTEIYLLLMPGDKPFKTKYLSAQIDCARLSFADPGDMSRLLHTYPGAVTPLGLLFDKEREVSVLIDSELLDSPEVLFRPCHNAASVKVSLSSLLDRYLPFTGHSATVVTLPREL